MKKLMYSAVVWMMALTLLLPVSAFANPMSQWVTDPNKHLPEANLTSGLAFVFPDFYLAGGYGQNQNISKNFWGTKFGVWGRLADLPQELRGISLLPANDKLYVIGGRKSDNTVSDKVWEYDPVIDSWTEKKPLSSILNQNTGRESYDAAVVDGKIYLFAGYSDIALTNGVLAYDPVENDWEQKTLNFSQRHGATVVNDGKVYFFGGQASFLDTSAKTADVRVYDPILDQVELLPLESQANWTARSKAAAVTLSDGRIMIMGGLETNGPTQAVSFYNPITNTWAEGPNLPFGIQGAKSFVLPMGDVDIVMLMGGANEAGTHLNTEYAIVVPLKHTVDLSQVGIHVANGQLTNTTTAMEYRMQDAADDSWRPATANFTWVDFEPGTVLVREAADHSNHRSVGTIAPVAPAPAVTADTSAGLDAVRLMGATTAMEYTLNGVKWFFVEEENVSGAETIDASGENDDLRVRISATPSAFASLLTNKLNVLTPPGPLDLSQVSIDVAQDLLTHTTTAMEYSLNGGVDWELAEGDYTLVDFQPGMIYVREAADPLNNRHVATIAPPGAAPSVTADTSEGLDAVKLVGATTAMDYTLNGTKWHVVREGIANGTETIDASGGNDDLRVRISATAAALPSQPTDKLNVLTPPGPLDLSQVSIDVAQDLLTHTTTAMEYSLNGGVDWELAEGDYTLVDFQPGMIYVREAADPLNNRHVATIAPPGAAPAVTADTRAGLDAVKLIGATSDMDYTLNGTKWHRLTPAMASGESTIDASGENDVLQVRHGATQTKLPSLPTGKLNLRHVPNPPANNGYYPIYEAPKTPETPGQIGTNNVDIYVDGVKQDSLATASTEQTEGRAVTTVTVDTDKVLTKLQEQESRVITIPVTATEGDIITELSASLFQALAEQQVLIELVTDRASYTLPAELIDLDEAARTLDAADGESDLTIAIRITEADQATIGEVEAAAKRNQQTLLTQPVAFQVTVSSGEKSLEITEFVKYVERSIALDEDVDSSRITTGVVLGEDGELYHVPTTITLSDGKYYAHIKSLTNSVYAVVWNPQEFTDLEQHWSREEATDMAARMIVPGMIHTMFAPNEKVTRAEFAVMTVRALGLQPAGPGELLWTDVSAADRWEADLRTAQAYGIARGDEKGSFHPHQTITRAEASSILARALEVAGLEGTVSPVEAAALLAGFKDGGEVAGWAAGHIGAAIQAGILHGDNDMIRPSQEVNRAQAAAMLRRLLVAAELINE